MKEPKLDDYARGYKNGMELVQEDFLALHGRHVRLCEMAKDAAQAIVEEWAELLAENAALRVQLDAARAAAREAIERAAQLCEARRQKVLANPDDPSWTEHFAELKNEIRAVADGTKEVKT
jgi:hypothetical protein